MKYEIIWKTKALKQAKGLPADDRTKVSQAVGQLASRDNWKQVKQLTNHQYDYRLRIGRYRVLFNCAEEIKVVKQFVINN